MKSENIITKLAITSLSTVFSGPSGAGKTTTELAWLAKVLQLYPDALVHVAGQKYDPWCGLWRIPETCTVLDGLNFQPLSEQVNLVYNILQQRKRTPPLERCAFHNSPVWLILADWSVTYNTLSGSKKYRSICDDVIAKLQYLQAIVEFSRSHPGWISARQLRNKAPFKRQVEPPRLEFIRN